MSEQKVIDASKIIGIYPICSTGAVLVYAINYEEDKVLAGINENAPEWCDLKEEFCEDLGEELLGFSVGSFFIPLFEVQRFFSSVG